jgi:hypothetical protein
MTSTLQVQTLQGPTSGADSNIIRIADGHTLVGGQGSVIQEQVASFPDYFTNDTPTIWVQTGMEVAITPKLSSSKIMVSSIFNVRLEATASRYGMAARLYNLNTSSPIGLGKDADGFFYSDGPWSAGSGYFQFAVRAVDDQTNSTELRNYGLAFRNYDSGSTMTLHTGWGTSTITATEVAQ